MPDKFVEFGEWLPDQPSFIKGGLRTAKNIVSAAQGYLPFNDIQTLGNELNGRVMGAVLVRGKDGTVYVYAGTQTDLYRAGSIAFSASQYNYNTDDQGRWEFARWNDTIIATNFADDIQKIDIGATQFFDLGGGPPKARTMDVVRDFLVVGNIDDPLDGLVPNRIAWSAFGDIEDWGYGSNQSDISNLRDNGGWVQRITGGETGIIFQERAISRMDYVGGTTVFNLPQIERNRGTPAPNSVIRYGRNIFYLGQDGFYVLSDYSTSIPIGAEKINRYFLKDVNTLRYDLMSAAVDPENNLVFWSYQSNSATDLNTPDKMIIYNWVTNKFTQAEVDLDIMFQAAALDVTLEELGELYDTLEEVPYDLDSRIWIGGSTILLGGFGADHKLGFFQGSPLTAEIETEELGNNRRTFIQHVHPLIEGNEQTTVKVSLKTRDTLREPLVESAQKTPNSIGRCNFRNNSRYSLGKFEIEGGFEHAKGALVSYKDTGRV